MNWEQIHKDRDVLAALYPNLFCLVNPVPLSIGIDADLYCEFPELSRTRIRRVLRWLTIRRAYLIATKLGVPRHCLAGVCGEVDRRSADYAMNRFLRRNQRAKDKWHLRVDGEWIAP